MPVCPNPQCPYLAKFGSPAEYRAGFETCSDCGTKLVEAAAAAVRAPVEAAAPITGELMRRVAVSAGVFFAVAASRFVPLPGVEAVSQFTSDLFARAPARIGNIGLEPFITAAVFVELVALVIPPWRRLRTGGPAARGKLAFATMLFAVPLTVLQAFTLARFYESQGMLFGLGAASVALLLGGVALALHPLAYAVRRFGVGGGYSVVLLGLVAPEGLGFARKLVDLVRVEVISIGGLLLIGVIAAACVYGALWVCRNPARLSGEGEAPGSLLLPLAGVVPVIIGGKVMSVLYSVTNFGILGWLAALLRNNWTYLLMLAVIEVNLVLLLSVLFHRPRNVALAWTTYHPKAEPARLIARARALLPRAMAISMGFAVVAGLSSTLLTQGAGVMVPLGSSFFIAIAILLELFEELRFRRAHGPVEFVWPVHRMYEVEPVSKALGEAGVPALARASHHRSMLHFFGPFIPVEMLVPADKAKQAKGRLGH